jgi:hypothetical protein
VITSENNFLFPLAERPQQPTQYNPDIILQQKWRRKGLGQVHLARLLQLSTQPLGFATNPIEGMSKKAGSEGLLMPSRYQYLFLEQLHWP